MSEHTVSIDKTFGRQPFLLTPSTLERLAATITARKQGTSEVSLAFSDGKSLENVNIARESQEENQESHRLTSLSMSFRTEEWRDSIRLKFTDSDYSAPISLRIQSKDPDWLALVGAELGDAIRSAAVVEGYERSLRIFKWISALLIISVAIFLTVSVVAASGPGQERVNGRKALRTNLFWIILIGH